jgi:hypothetical protein
MTSDPRDERVDVRLRRAIEAGTLPKELLLCGPAGTGKTFAALSVVHTILADYPGVRALLLRQTRASLTSSALVTFEQEILPSDGMERLAYGARRKQRDSYRYPNGSELVLGGLDRPDKVLSTAWDLVYVNEATETEEAALDTLSSRLDRPGRPSYLGFLLLDTNPSTPDHWLKKRCDEGRTAIWDTTHRANPCLYDGRDWTEAGRKYLFERLAKLTGSRRKRLLDGLWAAAEGVWFESFGDEHITTGAAYQPLLPVRLAIDPGVLTGALAFQVLPGPDSLPVVTVFWDHLAEGLTAFQNAEAIVKGLAGRLGSSFRATADPAGSARNPIGPTVFAEFARAGLAVEPWPVGSVADSLAIVEALIDPQGGRPRLLIHPSCKHLTTALANYRRKKRGGQWADRPEDPQHPHEDLVDALRGGLKAQFPEGLTPPKALKTKSSKHLFY